MVVKKTRKTSKATKATANETAAPEQKDSSSSSSTSASVEVTPDLTPGGDTPHGQEVEEPQSESDHEIVGEAEMEAAKAAAATQPEEEALPVIQSFEEATADVAFEERGQKTTPDNQKNVLKALAEKAGVNVVIIKQIVESDDSLELKIQRLSVGWAATAKRAFKHRQHAEASDREIEDRRAQNRQNVRGMETAERELKNLGDSLTLAMGTRRRPPHNMSPWPQAHTLRYMTSREEVKATGNPILCNRGEFR